MSRVYARVIVWLRWPLALTIIAGVVLAAVQLPSLQSVDAGTLGNLVPPDSQAIKTETDASERLGAPILSRTLLVQRKATGFTPAEQRAIVDRAARAKDSGSKVLGAVPFINLPGVTAKGGEESTTAITGLFFDPAIDPLDQPGIARDFVKRTQPPDTVGVTGSLPAQIAQGELVEDRLPLVEIATALLVAFMVALYFRSVVAPLLVLGAVGMAFLLTDRMLAQLALEFDLAIPDEVHPVVVVLLFGVVTDYAIFYLSRARALLIEGRTRLQAAVEATAAISGIVTAAAITVAGASMALYASDLNFLRAFGPGMAGAVLIAWLVVVTFIPVSLGILGGALFYPSRCVPLPDAEPLVPVEGAPAPKGSRTVQFSVRHPAVTSVVCLLLLGLAISGVTHMRLGNAVIASLPDDDEVRQGYEAASAGVGAGAVAPTVLLVQGRGIADRPREVAAYQRWLEAQPGVATVLGPADVGYAAPRKLALSGNEARLVLLFRSDPLGGRAVEQFQAIKTASSEALSDAGLPGAKVAFAGDTAVTSELVEATTTDLLRIGAVVLFVLFVILAVYLKAIIAPLYLLASSVLALLAALGLGTYIFQDLLGYDGLSFFTLVTAGVLLVALGSDYNVFLVGDIWREARSRSSREAITIAASRTSKPITVAGLILALSFALLALVPVALFAEIAVVMFLGLLLDAFLVRTVLVPALISLIGSAGSWPGGRLQRRRERSALAEAARASRSVPGRVP